MPDQLNSQTKHVLKEPTDGLDQSGKFWSRMDIYTYFFTPSSLFLQGYTTHTRLRLTQLPTLPPGLKALHNLNNHFSATSKGRECSPCESEGTSKYSLLKCSYWLWENAFQIRHAHTHTQNFPHSPRNALQNASKGTHNTKFTPSRP